MTLREQLEAILAGHTPDQIPAICRLDKWYRAARATNGLPPELAGFSLEQVETHLGFGRPARDARIFKTILEPPVERIDSRIGDDLLTEWQTPRGTLRFVRRYGPGEEEAGLAPTVVEHPIRSIDDYAAFIEVFKHTHFEPDFDAYRAYDEQVGPNGLPMVNLGAIPFHEMLIRWTGYERGYLDLADRPDVVLEAVEAANTAWRRMWTIVAESPARLVMHGVNFDTQMTPPGIFREHFLSYLKPFNKLMHESGKWVAFHADGDTSGLLDLMVEADYDVAEGFTCEPLVRCTFEQARAAWKDRITIWGALPSTLLEPSIPLERLESHLNKIYAAIEDGRRFIFGYSDQAMPTSSWPHIQASARFVTDHAIPIVL